MTRFWSWQTVPSPNFCWTNFIKHPLVVTWEFLKLFIAFMTASSRMVCIQTFAATFLIVLSVNKPSIKPINSGPPPTIAHTIFDLGGLSLHFISGLPLSNGLTTILVVVDKFLKGIHFGALPSHYTVHKVVILFMDIVCKLHSFLRSLVFDRDSLFISYFWCELFRLSDKKLQIRTSYHPQMDDQTKVLNRILEQCLRAFVHDNLA